MAEDEVSRGTDGGESGRVRRGTRIYIGGVDPGSRQGASETDGTASGDSESGNDSPQTFQLDPPKRGRRAKASKQSAKSAADLCVGLLETAGRFRYGPARGSMTNDERGMIIEGMSGTMASLPAEITQRISELSAPVMMLTGILMYGYRMAHNERALQQSRAAEENASAVLAAQRITQPRREDNRPTPPVSSNGVNTMPGGITGGIPPTKDEILDLIEGST